MVKNYIEEHILLSERYEEQLKAVEWAKAEQARILKEKEKRLTKELKEKMTPIIMQAKKNIPEKYLWKSTAKGVII